MHPPSFIYGLLASLALVAFLTILIRRVQTSQPLSPASNDLESNHPEEAPQAVPTSKPRDIQIAEIGENTRVLRSRTWDRLKFEIEYARQKGTTVNTYLIQARETALIDPPGESFTDLFLNELQQLQYFQRLNYVILTHVNPDRFVTLRRLLELAPYVTVICSKPGANTLRSVFANQPLAIPSPRDNEAQDLGLTYGNNQTLKVHTVRDEEVLDLGNGHELQFRFVPTPRHPDALCLYDPATGILYTDKLFGAHVCDDSVFDEHWKTLDEDRQYYFDCLHAVQVPQVEAAIAKLEPFDTRMIAPRHGSVVRHSLSCLMLDYQRWCEQQQTKDLNVALLYTSAYGNTATLAQAIAKGIQASGVAVQSINCEFTDPEAITRIVKDCDGFIIGTPTLAGHPPTQIQTALGIVLSTATQTKVAGVFGSYGWSGEAVDLIESKLQDAGYPFGFESIRVKFKPTQETLNRCEAAGVEFARTLNKVRKAWGPRQAVVEAQSDRTGQAVGRVTGSLCVLTAKRGNSDFGFLTSSVSQAGFSPPAITVSVAKDREAGYLMQPGVKFVLNILKESKNLQRHFLKATGDNPLTDLATQPAANGCLILTEALSYLECVVQNRMECGDHWLLYATIENGKVLESTGVTAVNHRKSVTQY